MKNMAVALAGDDQRISNGGAIAGGGMADEEPVHRAELTRPDRVLDLVSVEEGVAVAQMRGKRLPVPQEVCAGLSHSLSSW